MSRVRTINIEAELPSLDEARRTLAAEIREAKKQGVRLLKVIHGYGSTGKGGRLAVGLRKSFALRKKEGVLRDFIAGEDFSVLNEVTLQALEELPELRGDPDLGMTNLGVTLLWLK